MRKRERERERKLTVRAADILLETLESVLLKS